MYKRNRNRVNWGFSILELLAVVTILGILAVIVYPRFSISNDSARQKLREHHISQINATVERWYIEKGSWPATDLTDIAGDVKYFPEGVPVDPVSGEAYMLNPTTHRVD